MVTIGPYPVHKPEIDEGWDKFRNEAVEAVSNGHSFADGAFGETGLQTYALYRILRELEKLNDSTGS